MKKSPPYLMPVPDRLADGFFDVVVRDSGSAVIFWDLNGSIPFTQCDQRAALAIRATAIAPDNSANQPADEQTQTLNDFAGHLLLALPDTTRNFEIELGWFDSENSFRAISSERITLPEAAPGISPRTDSQCPVALPLMRHARYGQIAGPIEHRRIQPGLSS
jgi:hypothetical protein